MKKSISGWLVAIAMATLSVSAVAHASAEGTSGVYVAGKVGASYQHVKDQNLAFSATEDSAAESFAFGSENKTSFASGVAVGYDFSAVSKVPVRLELDYTVRANVDNVSKADFKDYGQLANHTKVQLQTLMVNAYYDIDTHTAWTPYVSAGAGLSHLNLDQYIQSSEGAGDSRSHSLDTFAWSVGLGVAYAINTNWTVDLSYKYLDAGDITATQTDADGASSKAKVDVTTQDVLFGVRYTF